MFVDTEASEDREWLFMFRLSHSCSFGMAQWLFPIVLTAHNLEEAITFPGFVAAHRTQLPWAVSPGEFRFGIIVITVAAWAVTFLSWRMGRQSVWAYLLFGSMVATLVNVLAPQVPAAIVFRGYAPGVVTAVALNLPVMASLSTLAIREHYVGGRKAVLFGIGVPVAMVAIIPTLFTMGRLFGGAYFR